MTGSDIPVLEIEKLTLTKDGRGLIIPWDADNLHVVAGTAGSSPSANATAGWLRIRYTSGSTYGATGSTLYAPLYASL